MKISQEVKSLCESERPVNYTIKAVLHFDDGINKGNLKIRATNAQEAEKLAREKLEKQWSGVKKIEFLSVKRG